MLESHKPQIYKALQVNLVQTLIKYLWQQITHFIYTYIIGFLNL